MYELTNWVLSSSIDERKQAKKPEFTRKHWAFVYDDRNSTLKELLTKNKSVTLYDRSIQVFATEMFKVKEPYI